MLSNRSYLLTLIYSLVLVASISTGSEDPSKWRIHPNAQAAQNLPPSAFSDESEENSSLKIPSFQLEPYEQIINQISERKMDQLFGEAPKSLKGRKSTLMRNMSQTCKFWKYFI